MNTICRCPRCGAVWDFDGDPVIMMPWPHWECLNCHEWLAAF